MLSRIRTCTINGIDAVPVEVETQVKHSGSQSFVIVGLGDNAVRESRDRIINALIHSGFEIPQQILVNLAPAELKKEGSAFDLPIAISILSASGQLRCERIADFTFHGELSLDGRIRAVRGIVALTVEAIRSGATEIVVPFCNVHEARLVPGVGVVAVNSLLQLVQYLDYGQPLPEVHSIKESFATLQSDKSFDDVQGQDLAKRAMLIAAVGGHNLLMIGPPGCGKSMLAERFPIILPRLSDAEMLEAVKIYSIAALPVCRLLQGIRPYRAPHHVVSEVGLVGGGTIPKPGEISLAHHGVLFLDEFPEYRRAALEALRAPLEMGKVQITRAKATVNFPARFQLVAAMNPCPCGRLGVPGLKCLCTGIAVQAYLKKLSQPILDRIDLHVELDGVPLSVLANGGQVVSGKKSKLCPNFVVQARALALSRQGVLNHFLESKILQQQIRGRKSVIALMEAAAKKIMLSARGAVKVLKVSRTIADIAGVDQISDEHVAEALSFRSLERLQGYQK